MERRGEPRCARVGVVDGLVGCGQQRQPGVWSDGTTVWVADSAADKIFAYVLTSGARDDTRDIDTHAATFTVITSVPAEMVQRGPEPSLSTIERSLLFSIVHNALTNVIRHAGARRVVIELDCDDDELRLSVSDAARIRCSPFTPCHRWRGYCSGTW